MSQIDGFFYRLPTYERVGQMLEISLEKIGWPPDLKFRRAGLRKLLIMVWFHHRNGPVDDWYCIWQSNVWAYKTARELFHITLPAKLSHRDRARVESILLGWKMDGWEGNSESKMAMQWARRR